MATAPSALAPDTAAVEAFLSASVGDMIHCVSILPDGDDKDVHGRMFWDRAGEAAEWAASQNRRGLNVYWTVNKVRVGAGRGKPKKADIASARFVHVDIDPPKGGGAFDKVALAGELDDMECPPSFVLDSGGGLQAFWRLDAEAEDLPAIETINLQVRERFGADPCQNIDRLMRLPGSINWPNRKKAAAGRSASFASILRKDQGVAYSPDEIAASLPPARSDREGRATIDIGPVGLITADDLKLGPLSPLRSVIDYPAGRDHSGGGLRCAGDMLRAGFSPEQVLGILLNPVNAVSEHFLRQGDPRRAALRAIEKAAPGPNEEPASTPSVEPAPSQTIAATPYICREPSKMPQRPWVYGRQLLRGSLSLVVAPGATGKTALLAGTALALATGRALLDKTVWDGPKRVWLWNLEDSLDELARLIEAARLHWKISSDDLGGRLFVDSALDGADLKLAVEDRTGFRIIRPVVDALVAELMSRQIDVLIVDPFVSSHSVSENDNGAIDAIAKEWARVGVRANCSIVLAHHTAKLGGGEATAEKARGASALVGAARSVIALNKMGEDEAKRLQVEDQDRRRYFRAYDDKNNRAPPADKSDWYRMLSVDLGNGPLDGSGYGDSLPVVVPWTPPTAFDGVTVADLRRVQEAIAVGSWKFDPQAEDWGGIAIADVLGLDVSDRKSIDATRVKRLQAEWLKSNRLVKVIRYCEMARRDKPFIEVGDLVDPNDA